MEIEQVYISKYDNELNQWLVINCENGEIQSSWKLAIQAKQVSNGLNNNMREVLRGKKHNFSGGMINAIYNTVLVNNSRVKC